MIRGSSKLAFRNKKRRHHNFRFFASSRRINLWNFHANDKMKITLQSPVMFVVKPNKKGAPMSSSKTKSISSTSAKQLLIPKLLLKRNKKQNASSLHASAKIIKIEPLTSDIKLVTLKITNKISFQAGQFIGVYHPNKDSHEENSIFPGTFSIASPPKDLPYVSFAIGLDHNPRNLRHYLYFNAKIGDKLHLDHQGSGTVAITPNMVMTPVGGPGGLVLIGGGSAVMGLVSIVEELLAHPRGCQIPFLKLLHSNRSNQAIPFYKRMKELQEKYHGQFSYQPFVTGSAEPNESLRGTPGRITVRDLANVVPGARLFCICGSGIFCEAMVNSSLELGVWAGSIRTDYTTRVDYARKLEELENSATSQTESSYSFTPGHIINLFL
jgi:ferredoxin-NADP reductase